MKHADKFYESQLNTINEKLVKMGSLLEKQFSSALVVLHSRDEQLAQKVVDNDDNINQLNHEISDFVFQIIAMSLKQRLPKASKQRLPKTSKHRLLRPQSTA